MWIVLYINCTRGKFIPYGPFTKKDRADSFAFDKNKSLAFPLYEVLPLNKPGAVGGS